MIPFYRQKVERPTETRGFRIYQDQVEYMRTNGLLTDGTSSKLVRILIDEYIAGRVPVAKIKMLKKGLL